MSEEPQELCGICARKGKKNKIQVYQINFDEAIRFCEDEECSYPLGLNQTPKAILSRPYTDINIQKKNIGQHESPTSKPQPKPKIPASNITFKNKTEKNSLAGNRVLTPYTPGQAGLAKQTPKRQAATLSTLSTRRVNASLDSVTRDRNGQLPRKTDKPINTASHCSGNHVSKLNLFYPQWQNKEALCWLDVIMCLMVHNKHMQELGSKGDNNGESSVLKTLVKAYNQAVILLNTKSSTQKKENGSECLVQDFRENDLPETSVPMAIDCCPKIEGQDKVATDLKALSLQDDVVKTGAGFHVLNTDFLPLVNEHGSGESPKAFTILNEVRESIWHMLHPRLKCQKGKNDSPVFAIPLIAKHSKDLEKLLLVRYNFRFHCNSCNFQKTDVYEKVLPTFPNVASDFQMQNPAFIRSCFKCQASSQSMRMEFLRLPEVLMLHFVEGLPHNRFTDYNFHHNGLQYEVSGFVQYKSNPDHFVAWIRDPKESLWMECNDLKSPLCQFMSDPPKIPSDQIHIVMWERITTENTEVVTPDARGQMHMPVPEDMETSNGESRSLSMSPISKLPKTTGDVSSNIVATDGTSNNGKTAQVSTSSQARKSDQVVNPAFTVRFLPSGQLIPVPSCVGALPVNHDPISPSSHIKTFTGKTNSRLIEQSVVPGKGENSVEKSLYLDRDLKNITASASPQSASLALLRSIKGQRSTGLISKLPWRQRKSCGDIDNSSKDQGIIAQILSARKNSCQGVKTYSRSRIFEGYRPKSEDTDLRNGSSPRWMSSSQSECSDSRPASPTLSTHSDSIVVQKRKVEVATERKHNTVKRRRSQDVDTWSDGKSSNSQRYSRLELVNKTISARKTNLLSQKGQKLIPSSSQSDNKTEVPGNSECEILQELYSALNLTLPTTDSNVKESCSTEETSHVEADHIPDITDLDNFVYGSNNENSIDVEMDNFLSQL